MVQVRLLGPVGVGAGGEVALGGGRQQALFAMLAAHTPPRRTDEQIVEGLWGEDPPASARNAVQVYVSGLRKSLAGVGIEIVRQGDGYALAGTALEIDSVAFETSVAKGRAALRAGSPELAVTHFARATALWVGEPLDGLSDLAFTGPVRLQLAATRRTAIVELSTALLRCGRYDDAVAVAAELLVEHPYDERGWIALATGHYWAGRQDEALATCRQARDTLASELGVDPGLELSALEQQILRHELPNLAASEERAAPEAPGDPISTLPPLPDHVVGREDALREVIALLDDGARLVTLLGIGGIGKTTLAISLAHRMRAVERAVVFCDLSTETDAIAALEAMCRALGHDPGDDPVAVIASAAPDVLVLDNLEQLDGFGPPLARVLGTAASLQIVATSRRPVHVRGEHEYRVRPLTSSGALGSSPAEELFRARARRVRSDVGSEPEAVRDLVQLLDGIPLAIELAAGRVRSQSPAQLLARIGTRHAAVLDLTDDVDRPARQMSLRVVLEAAVEATSPAAHAVLAALAWCDGWLSEASLETAVGRSSPGSDLVTALDELIAGGLMTAPEDERVRLSAPVRELVRDRYPDEGAGVTAVILELSERRGPELSGKDAAAALARLSADGDAIATLLNRAAMDGVAVDAAARVVIALRRYWLLTSRLAEVRRWVAAIRGSTQLDGLTDARLGIIDGTVGQWLGLAEAGSVLERALADTDRLRAAPDPLIVGGWCNLAADAAMQGDADRASVALARASREAGITGDTDLTAMVGDLRGFVASQLGDHAAAVDAGMASLSQARLQRDDYLLLERLTSLAESLVELGRDEASLDMAREAFDRMAALPPSPSTAAAMAVIGMVETVAGDLLVGEGQALEALRICRERYPSSRLSADLLVILAASHVNRNDAAAAAQLLGASQAIRESAGLNPGGLHNSRVWGVAALSRDRLDEQTWRLHSARGAADPEGVVARFLDGSGRAPALVRGP